MTRTLSSFKKGWDSGNGSTSKVSNPAPAIDFDASASIKSGSFMIGPLDIFTIYDHVLLEADLCVLSFILTGLLHSFFVIPKSR